MRHARNLPPAQRGMDCVKENESSSHVKKTAKFTDGHSMATDNILCKHLTNSVRCVITAVLVPFYLFLSGCSAAFWQGFAHGMATAEGSAGNAKLMIFGGENHDVYLGCLNCSEYATDSVFNKYGSYGSEYSGTSIYNSYGQYGSAYSSTSPCNPYASNPPIVVDQNGNFYGYLTLNQYLSGAITDARIRAWLQGVCGG